MVLRFLSCSLHKIFYLKILMFSTNMFCRVMERGSDIYSNSRNVAFLTLIEIA